MRLVELNAKAFSRLLNFDRKQNATLREIRRGFRFAHGRAFPDVGSEKFQNEEGEEIDEELFVVETVSLFETKEKESVLHSLALFLCSIDVFNELLESNYSRKELWEIQQTKLSFVESKITQEKLKAKIEKIRCYLK